MTLVVDASYVLAVALAEGEILDNDVIRQRIADEGALVPSIWRYEIANTLLNSVRRKRISAADPSVMLAELGTQRIAEDPAGSAHLWSTTLALAERHGITVYDASYLELAHRHGVALATLDGDLARAARREGVEVLGLRA